MTLFILQAQALIERFVVGRCVRRGWVGSEPTAEGFRSYHKVV